MSDDENKILKKAIDEIIDCGGDVGIYPKSARYSDGEIIFEKRTDFMKGWNAGVMHMSCKISKVLKKYNIHVDWDGNVTLKAT